LFEYVDFCFGGYNGSCFAREAKRSEQVGRLAAANTRTLLHTYLLLNMAYPIQEMYCKAEIGSCVSGVNLSQSDCRRRRGSHFPKLAISSANLQQGVKKGIAQSLGIPLN
jgi:hypothetical protein